MFELIPDPDTFNEIEQWLYAVLSPSIREQRQVDRAVRRGFAKVFGNQGGAVGWQPLAEATVAERLRMGYPGRRPILIRTGEYSQSFTQDGHPDHVFRVSRANSAVQFEVGSAEERVQWLEYGTTRMPARPVVDLDDRTESEILNGLDDIYDRLFDRIVGGP